MLFQLVNAARECLESLPASERGAVAADASAGAAAAGGQGGQGQARLRKCLLCSGVCVGNTRGR